MKEDKVSSSSIEVVSKGAALDSSFREIDISSSSFEILERGVDLSKLMKQDLISKSDLEILHWEDLNLPYRRGIYNSIQSFEILHDFRERVFYNYEFRGTITEQLVPTERTVYVYDTISGRLLNSATSSGSGGFTVGTSVSGGHYLVCLDDDTGNSYNDLVAATVIPVTTSG